MRSSTSCFQTVISKSFVEKQKNIYCWQFQNIFSTTIISNSEIAQL